jgi:hypothetical protein
MNMQQITMMVEPSALSRTKSSSDMSHPGHFSPHRAGLSITKMPPRHAAHPTAQHWSHAFGLQQSASELKPSALSIAVSIALIAGFLITFS